MPGSGQKPVPSTEGSGGIFCWMVIAHDARQPGDPRGSADLVKEAFGPFQGLTTFSPKGLDPKLAS